MRFTIGKIRVIYLRNTFIHVCAEMLKITFTFSMLSCDWRDDLSEYYRTTLTFPWMAVSSPASLYILLFI